MSRASDEEPPPPPENLSGIPVDAGAEITVNLRWVRVRRDMYVKLDDVEKLLVQIGLPNLANKVVTNVTRDVLEEIK